MSWLDKLGVCMVLFGIVSLLIANDSHHRNKNRLVSFCWCNNKLAVQNNNKRQVYQVVTSQYQAILWVVSTEPPDQCRMIRLLADYCCNQESQLAMMVIGHCPQNTDWSFLEKKFCLGFFIFRFLSYHFSTSIKTQILSDTVSVSYTDTVSETILVL